VRVFSLSFVFSSMNSFVGVFSSSAHCSFGSFADGIETRVFFFHISSFAVGASPRTVWLLTPVVFAGLRGAQFLRAFGF